MTLAAACYCEVCLEILSIYWTSVNGIGCCKNCKAPHIIYLYDSKGEITNQFPLTALSPLGLVDARSQWRTQQKPYYNLYSIFPWSALLQAIAATKRESLIEEMKFARSIIKNQGKISVNSN